MGLAVVGINVGVLILFGHIVMFVVVVVVVVVGRGGFVCGLWV